MLLTAVSRGVVCGSVRAPPSPPGMTIRFVLMVNKQGQTRLAQYYETHQMDERCALEAEVIRKCLSRTDTQCSFYEYRGYKVVYRRYASLFFIVGVEGDDENELAVLEFIHALVETLDRYFENVVCARALKADAQTAACPRAPIPATCTHGLLPHVRARPQCELDIMFNLEKAHFILDEMVMNGCIIETNKTNVLAPVQLLDKAAL